MSAGFTTWLVVPAPPVEPGFPDMRGQLRVVSKKANAALGLADYRANPEGWCEAGLVTAGSGRMVCLEAPQDVWQEIIECEPIRPPLTVHRPID